MENKLKLAQLKAKRRKDKQDASETILRRLEEAVDKLQPQKVDVAVDTTELKQILGELELSPTFKSGDVVVDTEIFAREIKGLREYLEKGVRQPSEIKQPLEELVEALKLKPSQSPEEFVPYRRVIRQGNRLVFDDYVPASSSHGGGSTGGGSSSDASAANQLEQIAEAEVTNTKLDSLLLLDYATEAKQDDIIGAVEDVTAAIETIGAPALYRTVIDETTTANVTYIGKAVLTGSSISKAGAVWQIKKIDETSGTEISYADGDTLFNNVWNNRATTVEYN